MSPPVVHHITHPLVQHKLTLMRQKDRSTNNFRRLLHEISMLMAYEVTRDMPTQLIEIETPLETMQAPVIDGKKTVFVVIMRAGSGFLDGMLDVVPGARVGHVGLYRDPKSLVAVEYYFKMPHDMADRDAIVLDPMLATGNSAVAAVERLKETRPKSIRFVCLLAAPEGLKRFHDAHPDVPVYTAGSSTNTATSCRAWATPATGCSAPSSAARGLFDAAHARRALVAVEVQVEGAERALPHDDARALQVDEGTAVVGDAPDLAVAQPDALAGAPARKAVGQGGSDLGGPAVLGLGRQAEARFGGRGRYGRRRRRRRGCGGHAAGGPGRGRQPRHLAVVAGQAGTGIGQLLAGQQGIDGAGLSTGRRAGQQPDCGQDWQEGMERA
jgi:uracil phosphoribosyltransferase